MQYNPQDRVLCAEIFAIVVVLLTTAFNASAADSTKMENDTGTQSTPYPTPATYTIVVHLDYFICDPDLDPWIAGDPDPYFIVHVDEQNAETGVYDGHHEIYLNLNFTFTITPLNPVVLIRIEAWDDDTGLTLADDEIDIDPNAGTALDLWYNVITKTWTGDVNGTLACGDASADWGKLAFYIDSWEVQNPLRGDVRIAYLNTEPVYIDGVLKSVFRNQIKNYGFMVDNRDTFYLNFSTEQTLNVFVRVYNNTTVVAEHNFTGVWQVQLTASPGMYYLTLICNSGHGFIEVGYNTNTYRIIPMSAVLHAVNGNTEYTGTASNFLMFRMLGMNCSISLYNAHSASGSVFVLIRNIEADMFEFSNAMIVCVGRNAVLLRVSLQPGEVKHIQITPWYVPDDYWFVFMSDSQPPFTIPPGGNVVQSVHFINIINQTNAINPVLIIHSGDYVDGLGCMDEDYMYGTGYTSPVNDYEYGELLETLGYLKNYMATTVGNHDVSRGHNPGMGEALYKEWLSKLYYSFDYGNVHFIIVDTYEDQDAWWFVGDKGMYGGYIYGTQKDWLYNDIYANTKPITCVSMHHSLALPPNPNPDWTVNETFLNRSNAMEIYNLLKGNVSQIFCGHIHDYIYYNLTATSGDVISTQSSPGLPCIMAGNAGGDLDKQYFPYYGFVMVHVNQSGIMGHTFIREDQYALSVTYSRNDGTQSEVHANITNTGCAIPQVRLKFVLSNDYGQYMAYSATKNQRVPVALHRYDNYTIGYVSVDAPLNSADEIVVCPERGIQLDADKNIVVLPNSTVLIPHVITNTGLCGERVLINVSTDNITWSAVAVDSNDTPISEIYIPALSSKEIFIKLTVPDAGDGDRCNILLNVSINGLPWVYAALSDTATCMIIFHEYSGLAVVIPIASTIVCVLVHRYRRHR